jgi:hypothetical protein
MDGVLPFARLYSGRVGAGVQHFDSGAAAIISAGTIAMSIWSHDKRVPKCPHLS